jgi:hypothetical protein
MVNLMPPLRLHATLQIPNSKINYYVNIYQPSGSDEDEKIMLFFFSASLYIYIYTFCKRQARFQLCIGQCAGRQAEKDQSGAGEGCTNPLHC